MSIIKRVLLLLLCCVLPACAAFAEIPEVYRESELRRQITLPNGAGPFWYYAQNDPIWNLTRYEAPKATYLRPFGDGGCNPTALAMVIATLLPPERLPEILTFCNPSRDIQMCEHSLTEWNCTDRRTCPGPVSLETPEDFLLTLPLVFANYATGNNPSRERFRVLAENGGGTSHRMFAPILEGYGLTVERTPDHEKVLEALDEGGLALALCSGSTQPFSGTNGHFVVVVSYDDEYLYVFDPYIREEYKRDWRGIIEPVEVGVKKVRHENVVRMEVGFYDIIRVPEE